jgi:hypothetical protein
MSQPHPPVVVLGPNQPAGRFYAGGERIAAFRGLGHWLPFTPEDWVGSTTSLAGEQETGVSRLPGGESLADAVVADPVGWLGVEHVEAYGADPALLVKLLDAGERLPVHAHPTRQFAAAHVGSSGARVGDSGGEARRRRDAQTRHDGAHAACGRGLGSHCGRGLRGDSLSTASRRYLDGVTA